MDRVLLACSTEKIGGSLTEFLKSAGYLSVTVAGSGSEARRLIAEGDYDLIVVNAPLSDEFGHELSLMVTESTSSGVILLVKAEIADDVSARVESEGVLVLPKPIVRAMFYQALRFVTASRQRILGLKKENDKLQHKIEEIRLVDRAKCVLIQVLKLTEQQAHRYIEKQAMDRRCTRGEVAEEVLKTYEM
ncbi:MAG: ANTAR domain-containing protein [Clostridiales bacterium]|nr:ANTAR domain-containing protein [Clostridiales bacterium]